MVRLVSSLWGDPPTYWNCPPTPSHLITNYHIGNSLECWSSHLRRTIMLIVTLKRSVGRRQAQACMPTNSSFAIFPSVWVQLYPSQSQIRTHLLSIIPQTAVGPLYTSSPHILHTHIHVRMHTPPRGFLPHFHSLCSSFLFCFQCIALLF